MKQLEITYILKAISRITYPIFISTILYVSCSLKEYTERDLSFSNGEDKVRLSATLTMPKGDSLVPAVVLIHGSGAHDRNLVLGKHKIFEDMAKYLCSNGIAVLRYDKRGCGKSGGIFVPFDLQSFTSDGLAAIEYLRSIENIDENRIGAIGISQGGIVTPLMATQSSNVNFIVMMAGTGAMAKEALHSSQMALSKAAGYSQTELERVSELTNQLWELLLKEEITENEKKEGVQLLLQLWKYIDDESRKDFGFLDQNASYFFNKIYRTEMLMDFYKYNPEPTLKALSVPVLAMNGEKDVQVVAETNLPPIEMALKNGNCPSYEAIILKDHNHLFQKCETGKISEYKYINHSISEETLSILVDWIKGL